jgi:transposase
MSKRELRRVGVLARVASEELKLVDAAKILSLSYRQVKRIWRRYEKEGAEGLKHRGAGRGSNRAKRKKFRARVMRLLRKKYSGAVGERFGPTLASEHLVRRSGQAPGVASRGAGNNAVVATALLPISGLLQPDPEMVALS